MRAMAMITVLLAWGALGAVFGGALINVSGLSTGPNGDAFGYLARVLGAAGGLLVAGFVIRRLNRIDSR